MLSHIVRPMVQTQVRLLANSRATRSVLISTVAQWLSFLGVRAQVEHLRAANGKIHLCLTVDQPEACDNGDWQKIVGNLDNCTADYSPFPDLAQFTAHQQSTLQRLLAYLIQVGSPDQPIPWDTLQPQLEAIGFDESTLLGVRAALKVPQSLDDLVNGLDADVAAIALPKAVSLAMMDRQVNQSEDQALAALLNAMKHESTC
jgi:hypothetical protein